MSDQTFRGLPCPVFIREYLLNGHKYNHVAPDVEAHLKMCRVCRQAYDRISEQIHQEDEDDVPGFRG